MALTQIRKEQIKDLTIDNAKIATNAGIAYSKLDLTGSIVATDLNADESVEQQVLESKLVALWDYVSGVTATGNSLTVTTAVEAAAAEDVATNDATQKGILTTGTGSNGTGSQNYRVQVRYSTSGGPSGLADAYQAGDAIPDGKGGSVYAELRHDGSNFDLYFFDSEDVAYSFAATPEITHVSVLPGSSITPGSYFTFSDGNNNPYYVWLYRTDDSTGSDPSPGGTGLQVTYSASDSAADVASSIASVVGGNAAFSATSDGGVVEIVNATSGAVTDATDGTSGFSISVDQQGRDAATDIDFMFVEVYSYQDAPTMGFITGMGFADVASVSGTHNHNDLYYTQTELEGGVLDDRYHTETELGAGVLDSRYFTETELNPNAAATGDNVLDARYYRETELGSTAAGDSGSTLIGVESTGNLASTDVQGALVELQGDIDDIVSGGLDITHSLDDAYDDGSSITVDSTDVEFNLSDGRTFDVTSDGGGTDVFTASAGVGGDTVSITADSTLTGDFTQSGGAVQMDAGANALDLDGGAITVDGSSIDLTSTGALTFNDQYMTSSIPLSETGETALDGAYTATSIIGALNEALTQASSSSNIGAAEDGTYDDGLFIDFVDTTPTGTAVDRFNEVLKSLAPGPAPELSSMSKSSGGVTGALSFGPTNPITGYTNHSTLDINPTFETTGFQMGIFAPSGSISGVLADNVSTGDSYPANAFGNGNEGTLKLLVNGVEVHTVDLTSAGSGANTNVNGNGFSALSAATPVYFDNSDPFDVFQYRTGSWTVDLASADVRNGYNTVQVIHTVSGSDRTTSEYQFVIDDAVTATSYSGEVLDSLSMTGSKQISGVTYNTGGTALYDITASNVYRNTYDISGNAVNFSGTNASAVDQALDDMSTEADDQVITDKTVTVSTSSRLLDESISMSTQVARTLQSTSSSTGATIGGILLDPTSPSSSDTQENFDDEAFRLISGMSTTDTGYNSGGSGPASAEWDSSLSLVGADAGHNDGLLVYDGKLVYPTNGLNGGNFGGVSNAPVGNPDYTTASGDRVYIRYFYDADPRSNFRLNVQGSSISFVSVATGVSSNNLTLEVLAPNTTQDGTGTVEWKDAVVAFTDINSIGCYASTYGSSIPTNWGVTLGSRNTSTSGNAIAVRITASSAWTGQIDSIGLTWL